MLHRNMINDSRLSLALDDLLADFQHARRSDDLGRLALLAYCEARRWAREAAEPELAELSSTFVTGGPKSSRQAFLAQIDELVCGLEAAQARLHQATPARPGSGGGAAARVTPP